MFRIGNDDGFAVFIVGSQSLQLISNGIVGLPLSDKGCEIRVTLQRVAEILLKLNELVRLAMIQQLDVSVFALDEGPSLDGDTAHLLLVGQDLLLTVGGHEIDALLDGRDIDRTAREASVAESDDAGLEVGHDEFYTVEQVLLQVLASLVMDDILGGKGCAAEQEKKRQIMLLDSAPAREKGLLSLDH